MDKELLARIIDKYLAGEASSEEIAILNSWFEDVENRPSLISALSPDELKKVSAKMFSEISKGIDECTESEVERDAIYDQLKNSQ